MKQFFFFLGVLFFTATLHAKDIKIFMQNGTNDLDNTYGNWWLANLQMEAAFKFKNYDHRFEKGTGAHSGKHGGAILPESLKWLWNDITNK